jgi:glycosyltransferase involved in cell wall biosynthesis
MNPTVSVIVPTYNRSGLLKIAVESVLNQNFTDYEIIITDNCSTDDTAEVVARLSDNRIRYYLNPANVGLTRNYNRALSLATGKYIAVFSDDDVMLPGNLAAKVNILDQYPSVGLVHSNTKEIDGQGIITNDEHSQGWNNRIWSEMTSKPLMPGKRAYDILYDEWNFVSMPTVMMRKNILDGAKIEFNNQVTFILDWDMWLNIARLSDFYFIEEPLVQIRTHGMNLTTKSSGDILFRERLISKVCLLQPDELSDDADAVLARILLSLHTQHLFLQAEMPTQLDLFKFRVKRMILYSFKKTFKQLISHK